MDKEKDVPSGTPSESVGGPLARAGLAAVGGAIPFFGGLLSAAAAAWSEHEQARMNRFLEHWLKMLQAEMEEKQQTILEIAARLDMHDEAVSARVSSPEYQSLLRKAFRDWAGAESEAKRRFIRNVLANAAATDITSDDVVRLFLDWLKRYSELHFTVIAAIYNSSGITRGEVWSKIGKAAVREDSAEADLFKLLFHDLSTGRIVRQHRQTDYHGNFIAKRTSRPSGPKGGDRIMKSAFDDGEEYELTQLGQQFVHYAMTDLPPKLSFHSGSEVTPEPPSPA